MDSKRKSRSVTRKGINGKSKTKDEAVMDNKVKELPLKDEFGWKVCRFNKSKGGAKSAVKSSEAGGRIEITKGKTNDNKNVTEDRETKNFETPMKRKRGADGEIVQAFLLSMDKGSSRLRPRKEVPEFKMVELADEDCERIIGKKVKVYWSGSRKWFPGRVKAFNSNEMLHTIYYEDGDKEDLNLSQERFQLEVMPGENFTLKPEPKSEKTMKGLADDMVIAEFLKNKSGEKGNSQLKKDSTPMKKEAPKNALRRGSSNPKRKDAEVRKAEDLVIEMNVEGGEKYRFESKSLLDKATDVNEPSEAQASRLESDFETRDMGSDGSEEGGKSVKGSNEEEKLPENVEFDGNQGEVEPDRMSQEAEVSLTNLNSDENEHGRKLGVVAGDGRSTSPQIVKDIMNDLTTGVEVNVHPIKVDEIVEGGEVKVEGICKESLNLQPSEPVSLEEDHEILQGKLKIINRESSEDMPKEALEESVSEGTKQTTTQGPKQPDDNKNANLTTLSALIIQKNIVRRPRTKVERQ